MNRTITAYAVYADTVGDALTEAGLALHSADKVNYALTDPVTDGMVIRVNTAFTVTLTADGKTQSFAMVEGTVGDLLDLAKVQLGTDDYTEPSATTSLKAGMKIHVYRVSYKTVTETETLSYKTETKTDRKLTVGKTKVEQQGKNGSADVTYKVKLVNGKEKAHRYESRRRKGKRRKVQRRLFRGPEHQRSVHPLLRLRGMQRQLPRHHHQRPPYL